MSEVKLISLGSTPGALPTNHKAYGKHDIEYLQNITLYAHRVNDIVIETRYTKTLITKQYFLMYIE